MKDYEEKIKELKPVEYSVYPDIELYMDQVLAYIARSTVSFRESENLTSAMVNNYIKDGLINRANGKKYSKEHITDLNIVARLKQVLSVKDMGVLLPAVKEGKGEKELYENFSKLLESSLENALPKENETGADLALRLAVMSYVYKMAGEYVIDTLTETAPEKKKKQKNTDQK